MDYAQFISIVRTLRDEGTQLFGRVQLREDRQFRKWRHELTDAISRISREGFPINCQVSARVFDAYASPDTPTSKNDRLAAYERDLLDTINELDTLIKRYSEFGAPAALNNESAIAPVVDSNVVSTFQKHWLPSLITLCAVVVAATWAVSHQLFVIPRDFEIARLKEALAAAQADELLASSPAPFESKVLLSNVGVVVGDSVTTPDGACTIRVVSAAGGIVSLDVTIGADDPQIIKQVAIGRRAVVHSDKQTYYIDLHRERGNMVDMSVSGARRAEQSVQPDRREDAAPG